MAIKKLMFCLLTIVVISSKAQNPFPSPYAVPNVDWIKYYSQADLMYNVPTAIDANSNVYSTGYAGGGTVKDLVSLKYDSTGTLIYSYQYNNGGIDIGNAIKIDAVGNAYIAGMSEDPGPTAKDYVVIKLSPSGSLLWSTVTRFDGGFGGGADEANAICVDASGDVYCTGKSQNSNGDFDIVTLKIDGSSGSLIWQHSYNGSSNLDDEGTAMVLSSDGQQVFITGYTTDMSSGRDIVTYALDASTGSYDWSPVITNGFSAGHDRSNAIILAGANIVICGEVDNSSSGMDYTTIKYDGTNGAIIWQQDYDKYSADERATSLARDSTGNIGVIGTSDNGGVYEYHTVLYDSTGVMYASNIESTGLASLSVDPKICNDTIAHHWYCSGEIMKATKDVFVYQLSPSATTAWRQYIDGQNSDIDGATGVVVNGVGVVYVCGLSKNSMSNFDYTTIKLNQTPLYWPPDYANEPVNIKHLYLRNEGQLLRTDTVLASEVLYYTHNTTPEVYIEKDAFNFVYRKSSFSIGDSSNLALDTIERIQYKFLNSNPWVGQHEYLPRSTVYNYFLGYAASPEITDVQGNERIFVPNFYPYVDLHYFSCEGGIKYYLVAKPGALLDEIMMQIDGEVTTGIDSNTGQLFITGQLGSVVLEKPIAYTVNWLGQVVPITSGSASWSNVGSNTYNIIAPTGYNSSMPLIIQVSAATVAVSPSQIGFGPKANLDYSTYYGGQGGEVFNDIKSAANGDRHITGWTESQYFPNQNTMYLYKGGQDAVVLKYTFDDTLRVASFMGGLNNDVGNSIDVNSSNGDVFIGGYTWSTDFPAVPLLGASNQTVNGRVPTVGDYKDGILARFTPSVTAGGAPTLSHKWSRYFGGPGNDEINSIYVDAVGQLYFVGEATSPTIAGLVSAAQPNNNNSNYSSDAILGKFDNVQVMEFGTYFGGSDLSLGAASRDIGMDITVDNSGKIIICGRTDANFIAVNSTGNTNTFYQSSKKGAWDGFLARYSSSGTKEFASYFGGNGLDAISRLAHDPVTDDIFFAGDSYDTTAFPFLYKSGALNSKYKTYRTAFIGQMGGNLTKKWCSFYGHGANTSSNTYSVSGLSVDNVGIVYMSGMTKSDTIHRPSIQPVTLVYKDSVKNSMEGFVAIFNHDQSLYHAHYFGGSNDDLINGSDVSLNQKLFVVGATQSNNFPIAYSSLNATEIDSTYNGGQDGFISGFDLNHYQVTGLSDQKFDKSSLHIYPNPTSKGFNLELQSEFSNNLNLKVFNLMGQLIYEQNVKEKKTSVNCESWTNGVYLISVIDARSQRTFKLIKN
jgi:hypothetical protein